MGRQSSGKSLEAQKETLCGVVVHGEETGLHWKSSEEFWPSALVLVLSEDRNGERT